jgi:hypothetical protein
MRKLAVALFGKHLPQDAPKPARIAFLNAFGFFTR